MKRPAPKETWIINTQSGGKVVAVIPTPMNYIAEDLACMEEQMAWFLITEIEDYLAKYARFVELHGA